MKRFRKISIDDIKNIQIDSGVLLKEFDAENPVFLPENVICATNGGINPVCEPEYYDFGEDVDNAKSAKETKRIRGWNVSINFTTFTTSLALIRLALGAADVSGKMLNIRQKLQYAKDFNDIWWVGKRADDKLLAIRLIRSLSDSGFSLQTNKSKKGQISVTLKGHSSFSDIKKVPMEIYVLAEVPTASLYLYGTPSESGNIGLRNGDSVTLYDGDLLPDINKLLTDEQMAKYPFMWISRIGGRRRRMIALPKVEVRYSNLVHWFGLFDGDESYVAAVYQNGQWGEIEENVNTNTNTYVGADMWKNFDIVYENEVLSSASPDPIQVSSMVGYSYNGAVLPEMPDSSYEYACITTNTNGYANLIISSTQLRYTNGIGFYAASDGACTIYTYRDGVNSEWVWNKDSTYEAQGLVYFTGQSLKWANYEMYNNNDGSLALDASDFVPVYE